ncbi:Protein S100-A1 [Plecturocebus cupreus]
MGSELETAMETLINVFHAHSGKEGDKYKLSKKELKELLQTELSGFLDAQKDVDAVDKVMKELDENGDGEVDFQEYVVLVAALTECSRSRKVRVQGSSWKSRRHQLLSYKTRRRVRRLTPVNPSTLGSRGGRIMRSGVRDQPGQHGKTLSLLKI